MFRLRLPRWMLKGIFISVLIQAVSLAEDKVSAGVFTANSVWMVLCTGLVFIMHLGFAALVGALMVGARRDKYVVGQLRPIPGHNIPLAAIGVFLLWLG